MNIEPLEPRIAPAVFAMFADVDGDLVTVSISKGTPPSATGPGDADIVLSPIRVVDGEAASQLLRINLMGNQVFKGANITVTATPQDFDDDGVLDGDGLVNVGFIDASGFGGIDLGAVKIEGDLGKLVAGDAILTTTGLASLSVLSLGRFGTSTGAPDLSVTVAGNLGALKVSGDVRGPVSATSLAAATIAGSVIDGGLFGVNGIGVVKVAGDIIAELVNTSIESTAGKIGSVTIGGKLFNASIQSVGDLGPLKIGGAAFGNITSAGGKIASVTIGGIVSSSIVSDGDLGPVKIAGDSFATIASGGRIASIAITGNWFNRITATGDIGPVKVGAGINGSSVMTSTAGSIASVAIAGTADGGELHAALNLGAVKIGGDAFSIEFSSGQDMGKIAIGGDLDRTCSIDAGGRLAGVTIGSDFGGGGSDPVRRITSGGDMGAVKIGGDVNSSSAPETGLIFSGGNIGSVTIGGTLRGNSATGTGQILATGDIGSVKIGGDLLGGFVGGTASLEFSGCIRAANIKSVFIAGSIIAGGDGSNTHSSRATGGILAVHSIGSVTVLGGVLGREHTDSNSADGDFNFATISARGGAVATGKTDLAIGKISIGGSVERANILAGYDVSGVPRNADAQIGKITIGGDLVTSNIVAGVSTTAPSFGTATDVKMSGAGVKDNADLAGKGALSKIASVIVKGSVLGTVASNDAATFAIVAQHIVALKIGGTSEPMRAGAANDLFPLRNPLGTTLGTVLVAGSFDFHAFEVA
jgi:hypothetical protein